MASLGEMLQYAEYVSKIRNPALNVLESGISGYMAGSERKSTRQRENLDTYLKLVDLQDRAAKLQRENQTATIQANMAKAFGFLPMDSNENTTAQVEGFKNIGDGKQKAPDSTNVGKLSQMFDAANYDLTPSYSSRNGFGFSFRKKEKEKEPPGVTPNQKIEFREKIRRQAEKMALSETIQKLKPTWDPIQMGAALTENTAASHVTEDTINKYLRPAELFLSGKDDEYRKSFKEIKDKLKQEADPLGLGLQ